MATTDAEVERVRELVAAIPPGPWHRVLRANGTPAPHLAHRQLNRLAAEGCPIRGDRVDLAAARYRFDA